MRSKLDPAKIHEKFRPYVGDHHNCIPENCIQRGGFVCFRTHIGKPLSDGLWEDIEFRLHVTNLRVYHKSDCVWLDGPINGAMRIILDDNYDVAEIRFAPHLTPAMMKALEKNKGEPWTFEVLPDIVAINDKESNV